MTRRSCGSAPICRPNGWPVWWPRAARTGGGPVLDLACGTGLVGEALATRGFARLTGVDLSADMLGQARAKGCYDRLVAGDVAALPDLGRFDQPLHLLDDLGRGGLDGFEERPGLLIGDDDGFVNLFLDFGGRVEVGFAEVTLLGDEGIHNGRALGGKAGGDIFGAFDFLLVTRALEQRLGRERGGFPHGSGAGLLGVAFLLFSGLRLATTAGAEMHSAALAAKAFLFTHNSTIVCVDTRFATGLRRLTR